MLDDIPVAAVVVFTLVGIFVAKDKEFDEHSKGRGGEYTQTHGESRGMISLIRHTQTSLHCGFQRPFPVLSRDWTGLMARANYDTFSRCLERNSRDRFLALVKRCEAVRAVQAVQHR